MADAETLIDMGVLDEQPQPPPDVLPDPAAEEQANALALGDALTGAGIGPEPADTQAIGELAKLDPAVIEVVTRWVRGDSAQPAEEAPASTE